MSTYNRLGVDGSAIRRRPPLVETIPGTILPNWACRALNLVRLTFREFFSRFGSTESLFCKVVILSTRPKRSKTHT